MATALSRPELVLRSPEGGWDRARWEELGEDGNRYEVINGVLYMSTAPRPLHQLVSRLAERALYEQIDDRETGITLHAPIGVFMPECDPVQPDLLVIRTNDRAMITDDGIEGVPTLIVEILSPSNRNQDLVVKRAAYARASVPEYWILRPRERDALLHSDPEPTSGQHLSVTHVRPGDGLISPTLPFRAPMASLFPE